MPERSDSKQMDLNLKYKPFIITKLIFMVYFNKIQGYLTWFQNISCSEKVYKRIIIKFKKESVSLLNSFSEMI